MTGKFALAATAKANETRNATFIFWANNASRIETTDTPIEAYRAIFSCSFSDDSPRRTIWP
ncbi:hypothetical protein D3C81_2302310 [compost metagenome]